MEKKNYENPELLVMEMSVEDVITTSTCEEDWDLPPV